MVVLPGVRGPLRLTLEHSREVASTFFSSGTTPTRNGYAGRGAKTGRGDATYASAVPATHHEGALRDRADATVCAVLHQAERLRAAQWRAYAAECRAAGHRPEAEAEAWARLQRRLAAIE